jgi:ferrous iron transport protein B
MGFVKRQTISIVKGSPLKDPIQYSLMDYQVSLRKSEASLIEVLTKEEAKDLTTFSFEGVIAQDHIKGSEKTSVI